MGERVVSALQPGDGIDILEVRGIRAVGRHGVLDEERRQGQPFIADIALAVDIASAASTDDLDRTVDYSVVAQAVYAELAGEPVDLIETLAQRIADRCLGFAGVMAVEVALHKPQAPIGVPADDVVLRILRRRSP